MKAASVLSDIKNIYQILDDLAKRKRNDGEVVAF